MCSMLAQQTDHTAATVAILATLTFESICTLFLQRQYTGLVRVLQG